MLVSYKLSTTKSTLFVDINDFVSQSGWFTFPGFALGTEEALLHVLAHKANINYEDFMKIENAVYVFTYEKDEKVSIYNCLFN